VGGRQRCRVLSGVGPNAPRFVLPSCGRGCSRESKSLPRGAACSLGLVAVLGWIVPVGVKVWPLPVHGGCTWGVASRGVWPGLKSRVVACFLDLGTVGVWFGAHGMLKCGHFQCFGTAPRGGVSSNIRQLSRAWAAPRCAVAAGALQCGGVCPALFGRGAVGAQGHHLAGHCRWDGGFSNYE
jgi:hypothetical protein